MEQLKIVHSEEYQEVPEISHLGNSEEDGHGNELDRYHALILSPEDLLLDRCGDPLGNDIHFVVIRILDPGQERYSDTHDEKYDHHGDHVRMKVGYQE